MSNRCADQREAAELLSAGEKALANGDLAEAISLYEAVLQFEPKNSWANYWLGVLFLKTERPDRAIPLLEAAALSGTGPPDFQIDLGLAWRALGEEARAERTFQAARASCPGLNQLQLRLSAQFEGRGKLAQAAEECERGLALYPLDEELLEKLAGLRLSLNQWTEALAIWRKLLQARPDSVRLNLAFAEACTRASEHDLAAEAFERALELNPGSLSILLKLGLARQKSGRPERARECFIEALKIGPDHPPIHKALGDVLREEGRWNEAIEAWQRAISLNPDYADAWQNLGLAFERQNRLEAALECHQCVVRLRPGNATAHRYLGMIRQDLGQLEPARREYELALSCDPEDAEVHWQKFFLDALEGKFPEAWEEYEWRVQLPHRKRVNQTFTQPAWDGRPLNGRVILLHAEQGFGDAIQAFRYVPAVAGRGGKVLLWVPPELESLARTIPGTAAVFSKLRPDCIFDTHLPLMSLPRVFRTDLESIPRAVPYLGIPAGAGARLPFPERRRPRIGLVWCGSRSQPNDRRPIPFDMYAPWLELERIEWWSLQTGPAAREAAAAVQAGRLRELGPHLTDFAETAAALAQLDLVITIDTAIAHLAGALGRPVWLLLAFMPDWRWLLHRPDSPWYPGMRLFRQAKPGDWAGLIEEVTRELSQNSAILPDGS